MSSAITNHPVMRERVKKFVHALNTGGDIGDPKESVETEIHFISCAECLKEFQPKLLDPDVTKLH